jgi:hypothetical protein
MNISDLIKAIDSGVAMDKHIITVYLKSGNFFRGKIVKNEQFDKDFDHINLYSRLTGTGKFFSCHKDSVDYLEVDSLNEINKL